MSTIIDAEAYLDSTIIDAEAYLDSTIQDNTIGFIRFDPNTQKDSGILDADAYQADRNVITQHPCAEIIEVE